MVLLAEVIRIAPEFEVCRSICEELSEFAVDVRYPGGISEPPEGEAERFVLEAETIFRRVKKRWKSPELCGSRDSKIHRPTSDP